MADAPPPAAFAPYRDSVDESAPLIPGDAEVGLAGAPAESGTQNGRTSRGFDIRSVTIASQVLLLTSVVVLLLEVAVIILYLVGDNEYKSHWLVEILSGILGTAFLAVFLSAANLAIFSRARARNETSPSALAIFINVVAHGSIGFHLILATGQAIEEISYQGPDTIDMPVVFLFIWVASVVVLGWIVFPALFIFWLRGLIIWYMTVESWPSLSLPGGELTLQASIKFHRQQPPREAGESA